eukprot:TRINITY_DN22939_c2_g1_i2.p1 TRINITY_DN22939_c2_g1~~TRINITY_DN22939_c2_g1_i2.p1  ORF type:complete len:486 (+),score=74.49 TRINITY_DN22939_c2_g1_i2:108-1565(+)
MRQDHQGGAGKKLMDTVRSKVDRFGRMRCTYDPSHYSRGGQDFVRAGNEPESALCTVLNVTRKNVAFDSGLTECGWFDPHVGAIVLLPYREPLEPQEIDQFRPLLHEAFAGPASSHYSAKAHDNIEKAALQWRWGTFYDPTSSCHDNCCVECGDCRYPHEFNLPWLMGDLLEKRSAMHKEAARAGLHPTCRRPSESEKDVVNILNFGCSELESHDPTYSLMHGRFGKDIRGPCVDLNETRLAEARRSLDEAGLTGVEVQQMYLTPDLEAMRSLVADPQNCWSPLDILKVDVDSFDVELAVVALRAIELEKGRDGLPIAVFVEFQPATPPPIQVLTRHVQPMLRADASRRVAFAHFQGTVALNSMSAAVSQLWDLGYRLHRVSDIDLLFLNKEMARKLGRSDFEAQDEWACYLEQVRFSIPAHVHTARRVLASPDVLGDKTLELIRERFKPQLSQGHDYSSPSSGLSPRHPILGFGFELGMSKRPE